MPLGICSSSASVGHSLSHGITDVVCLLSKSTALADAAATALGNRVKSRADLKHVAHWADRIGGILGGTVIVGNTIWADRIGGILGGTVIVGNTMANWGDIELVEV
ncbi:MAG: hypothetical protein B6240_10305 [Desulfobacteraceae bacterium 4572_87]|nr:MAG: hypothetical protein B6240_10305 [Desulfobacteraceae bacterium 4572_87]